MAAEREARGAQRGLPAFPHTDHRRAVKQPMFFLLLAQAGKLGVQRVITRHERLLAVEDQWLGAGGVFQAVDLAAAQRELDASE